MLKQGAISGGITGAIPACGGYLIVIGIKSKTLPSELIYIDTNTVYLLKTSISVDQIKSVTFKGTNSYNYPVNGKKLRRA